MSMAAGIYGALKKSKNGRRWESCVGYTLADLKRHIERQFVRGMAWKNHGKGPGHWHIDHIVPKVSFRLTGAIDGEFKACWALTNLRPLWQSENQSKSGKRLFLV